MCFATLVWPTSMPNLSSSPWRRGARQNGLARVMSRINRRISSGTLDLPLRRPDFQCQNDRNPARCQRTTVSGRTMASASKTPGARRHNPTNSSRSKGLKTDLFGELRSSTLIYCRRTRNSASSRERNKLFSAVHRNMRTSTIGREHHPIRRASQPHRISDKDNQLGERINAQPEGMPSAHIRPRDCFVLCGYGALHRPTAPQPRRHVFG